MARITRMYFWNNSLRHDGTDASGTERQLLRDPAMDTASGASARIGNRGLWPEGPFHTSLGQPRSPRRDGRRFGGVSPRTATLRPGVWHCGLAPWPERPFHTSLGQRPRLALNRGLCSDGAPQCLTRPAVVPCQAPVINRAYARTRALYPLDNMSSTLNQNNHI